jgi:hypothetical protein
VAIVDCMACLVTGVLTPVGFRDDLGIVHRVRWHVRGRPYALCDFVEDGQLRDGARPIRLGVGALIEVEEP